MESSNLNYLIGNTDAQVWAQAFVKLVQEKPEIATDEGTMIAWFANAIVSGVDEGRSTELKRDIVEKFHEIIYQCAGAATRPLLEDHPNYIFPSERVSAAIDECAATFGIPARQPA